MESRKVGTEIKATYKEPQWGESSSTFTQRAENKKQARRRAKKKGWELISTKEVAKYKLV